MRLSIFFLACLEVIKMSRYIIPYKKQKIVESNIWSELWKWDCKISVTKVHFLTFPAFFLIPIFFSNLNYNCYNLLVLRNLQEQVEKAFCIQKLYCPLTIWINCSSDLKNFANSMPASNFKSFFSITSRWEQFWYQNTKSTKYHFFGI